MIPGFTASFAVPPNTADWFTNIGLPLSEMALIRSRILLRPGAGPEKHRIRRRTDAFEAPWDWPPLARQDGTFDGMLSGLTASELTGGTYNYAVDYLGTVLNQAATTWYNEFDKRSAAAVDVITHSTAAGSRGLHPEPVVRASLDDGLPLPKSTTR